MVKVNVIIVTLAIAFSMLNCSGPSGEAGRKMEKGFKNPPESAKPRVWWHWMNGNISKEGIRADLEWMKRTGIAGFQNFDAGLATPQVVAKRMIYMTPEWKDAFLFTTKLADSLGLEMAIAGSPGWSESGGPWVTPEQAMKKVVWSETSAEGGKPFSGTIPLPPSNSGYFQNISVKGPDFYRDIALLAYRNPDDEITMAELNPKVTSSGGLVNLKDLTDGDLTNSLLLSPARASNDCWIQFRFAKPVKIYSLTLVASGGRGNPRLEASDNGRDFRELAVIQTSRSPQNTITFPPVTAPFFRVAFTSPPQTANAAGIKVAELVLYTMPRVHRFEEKAGFAATANIFGPPAPSPQTTDAIKKDEIIDLTGKMSADGKLEWTPPEGKWTILRLGYSLTGKENNPASPEATGLEVDKLNAGYVKAYFDNYLQQYRDATGGLMGKRGLQYIITDSWEARTQNWTDSMMTEFFNRRGYDLLKWMPVLTGRIVESTEASDKFLWDFRKTISDMTAEYHYDQLTDILHKISMGRYTESHESGRAFIADGMEVKRTADIPMSATWTPAGSEDVATRFKADVRESASVAHIYGQNLVAAESMTARGNTWAFSPERLKPTADMELASGLNRFVIHTSVHQPVNDKIPGLGLGPYGQWFTRHETWAEKALPWTTYLARSSFMLQQGNFVADIAYLYGEDNNITALFGNKLPDIPEGYSYDFVNSDAVLNVLSVENRIISTPGGTKYRLLVIDSSACSMSLPVLYKLRDLVNAGAIIMGPKPVSSPSLSDDKIIFKALADELWRSGSAFDSEGTSHIDSGKTIAEKLSSMDILPDFKYTKNQDNTELLFVHRRLPSCDIYWINNRNNRYEDTDAAFRVTGMAAEIWDPETGKINEASYSIGSGQTKVPLHLKPNDAIFVVFRKKTGKLSVDIPKPLEKQLAVIDGPWDISFQPDRGAPAQVTFEVLAPWNENAENGIKYFSGTGKYRKTINVSPDWLKRGTELYLDLGDVKNLAEVLINGKPIGIVWKTPFRVNLSGSLKEGENTVEVSVTNLWVNRLIGDQQPGEEKKYTYTTQAFYRADSPLLPSGLLGPVKIVALTGE